MKRSLWSAVAGIPALVAPVAWAGEGKGLRAEKAGLSKEQAEKLKDAFQEGRKTMRPLRRELRDAMTRLHDQVEDEADDAALKATLERIDKAKQAVASERARLQATLGGMPPVKQRVKWLLARALGPAGVSLGAARGR